MSVECDSCGHGGAEEVELSIREHWYKSRLCEACAGRLLVRALMPLMQIAEPIDTSQDATYNGRKTRLSIETGALKAVGSNLANPLHMGLRIVKGAPGLVGQVVEANFTDAEVLEVAAFLISRPQWAHAIRAMLAQRLEIDEGDDRRDDMTFRQKLKNAGKRALSEMRHVHEKRAS